MNEKHFIKSYLALSSEEKRVYITAFPNSLVAKLDIEIKAKNKGKLHKKVGVAKDKKIPLKDEEKELKSKDKTTKKEAQFAINERKWKHKGKKKKD